MHSHRMLETTLFKSFFFSLLAFSYVPFVKMLESGSSMGQLSRRHEKCKNNQNWGIFKYIHNTLASNVGNNSTQIVFHLLAFSYVLLVKCRKQVRIEGSCHGDMKTAKTLRKLQNIHNTFSSNVGNNSTESVFCV